MTASYKTVRVNVGKNRLGQWALMMLDEDKIPAEGEPFYVDDPSILGEVTLNKAISSYLREILSMIEDELPGERWSAPPPTADP